MRAFIRTSPNLDNSGQSSTPAFTATRLESQQLDAIPTSHWYTPAANGEESSRPRPLVALFMETPTGSLWIYLSTEDARRLSQLADAAETEANERGARVAARVAAA